MGQYTKAQITWQEFMELSRDRKDDGDSSMDPIPADEMQEMREEIGNRLESMEQAVEIEHAVNRILSGDFQHGIDVLTLYEEKYSEWWPLWYYLGVAYAGMEQGEQSVEAYKHALRLSPSNIQVMTELVEVFQSLGDWKNAEKYIEKIRVVQKGMEEEAREQNEE